MQLAYSLWWGFRGARSPRYPIHNCVAIGIGPGRRTALGIHGVGDFLGYGEDSLLNPGREEGRIGAPRGLGGLDTAGRPGLGTPLAGWATVRSRLLTGPGCAGAEACTSRLEIGTRSSLARGRRAPGSGGLRREAALGRQDAGRIGVKLCRAGGPAARGGGGLPGRSAPLPAAAPPARTRSPVSARPLPPPSARPGSSSLAARAQRSSAGAIAGLSARLGSSARPGPGGCPGPHPLPRSPPPSLPPCPAPVLSAARSPRLCAPRSHDASGPAARQGTRRGPAAPRPAPGDPRGRSGGR